MTQESLAISDSNPILETSHSEVEEISEVRETLWFIDLALSSGQL